MENNIIYALYCPINNIPVYIGKSVLGIDRPFSHLKENSHNKKVNEFIVFLKKLNLSPIIVILESNFKEEYIDSKEEYWIHKFLNKGNILLNQKNVSSSFFCIKEFDKNIDYDLLSEVRMFIKAKRKLHKLTQKDLSLKAGVGLRFIRELESGHKTNFQTDTIGKILKLFGNIKLSISFFS